MSLNEYMNGVNWYIYLYKTGSITDGRWMNLFLYTLGTTGE